MKFPVLVQKKIPVPTVRLGKLCSDFLFQNFQPQGSSHPLVLGLFLTWTIKDKNYPFKRRFGQIFMLENCSPPFILSQTFNFILYNFLDKINSSGFLIEMSKERLNCSCLVHQNYFLPPFTLFLWYEIKQIIWNSTGWQIKEFYINSGKSEVRSCTKPLTVDTRIFSLSIWFLTFKNVAFKINFLLRLIFFCSFLFNSY